MQPSLHPVVSAVSLLSADGNAWCNTSVKGAFISDKNTSLDIRRTYRGLEIGVPFLTPASADFWEKQVLFKSFFQSDLVSFLWYSNQPEQISRYHDVQVQNERQTKYWWNTAMRRWNKMFTRVKPPSLTAAVTFNFSGRVRTFKVISIMLGFSYCCCHTRTYTLLSLLLCTASQSLGLPNLFLLKYKASHSQTWIYDLLSHFSTLCQCSENNSKTSLICRHFTINRGMTFFTSSLHCHILP